MKFTIFSLLIRSIAWQKCKKCWKSSERIVHLHRCFAWKIVSLIASHPQPSHPSLSPNPPRPWSSHSPTSHNFINQLTHTRVEQPRGNPPTIPHYKTASVTIHQALDRSITCPNGQISIMIRRFNYSLIQAHQQEQQQLKSIKYA